LRLFYVDGTTPTSMIYYEAPAGANPITWTENWRILQDGSIRTANIQINSDGSISATNWLINSDGTTSVKLIGRTALESYSNTPVSVAPGTTSTLATINLTVPSGPNRNYLVQGFVNVSGTNPIELIILEGTTVIVDHIQSVAGRVDLFGSRVRALAPGSYTYYLQIKNATANLFTVYESNLIIMGGQPV
jgi:hypothetical protein